MVALFYDLAKLDQIAVNLFYGWGYNFYRQENQLRADDLMVRSRVGFILHASRAVLEDMQSQYRKSFLPPPTRAKPNADPAALESARTLEALCQAIGQLEGCIRALPVPENDRMTQRYRQEAATLDALRLCDTRLVGHAEMVRSMLVDRNYEWILTHVAEIHTGFAIISNEIQERQMLLQ